MRILVTGGAGFIGSHLVRRLLSDDYYGTEVTELTVLDSLTYAGNRANLDPVADDPRLRFVHGSIADVALVDTVASGHDAIINLAAESHVDRSIADASAFVSTNVAGTQVLLDAAVRHAIPRFVQVSTDEVYGSIAEGSWVETQPLAPTSPYSATKASSDLLALAYHRCHGLPVSVTRCSNNYGPYQFPEKVIPLFVTNLLEGRSVPLYGSGRNVRDWLHVSDHCRGIELVLEGGRAGEIYHIGGGTEVSNWELTDLLLEACGAGWDRVTPVDDRKGHDLRYSLDHSKITAELGYRPTVSFDRGIAETVAWYRNNAAWWQPLRRRAALVQA